MIFSPMNTGALMYICVDIPSQLMVIVNAKLSDLRKNVGRVKIQEAKTWSINT